MASPDKVLQLLETIRTIGVHLTDEEISRIALVLCFAMERMEKEEQP